MYALEKGVSINNITFSSDGNAGMAKKDANGETNLYKAPVDLNLKQVVLLIQEAGMSITDAFKIITTNPARNLSLPYKGKLAPSFDADLCFFDQNFNLTDVFSKGNRMMQDSKIVKFNYYEK
jgi:beta-aspartyl-dipeptidase (metallo-type)